MFSQQLDWGYFDHPPMTALLIWLGSFMGGEFGVRFFFTILQPLYLWILWCIIRPRDPHRSDATIFLIASAALPILQLYGFIAVPDVPLMMTAALFLLCYKRFTEDESILNMLLLGFTMALMAYSKYHGALVVLFTLLTNPRIFTRSRIYLSGVFALMLIVPHLWWQYSHDWVSLSYHLHDRNGAFAFSNITEHLLNTIAVFNPFFFPVYFMAWKRVKSRNVTERALYFLPILFFIFFTFSTLKGRVQPQWLIIASFGLIYILFYYTREYASRKLRRYIIAVGWITISLTVLARIELIWNPLGIRFEVFDNRPSFETIADVAGEHPGDFWRKLRHCLEIQFLYGKDSLLPAGLFLSYQSMAIQRRRHKSRRKRCSLGNTYKRKAAYPRRYECRIAGKRTEIHLYGNLRFQTGPSCRHLLQRRTGSRKNGGRRYAFLYPRLDEPLSRHHNHRARPYTIIPASLCQEVETSRPRRSATCSATKYPQRNSYHHDTNKSCHTRQPARKDLRYGLCDKSSTTELLV